MSKKQPKQRAFPQGNEQASKPNQKKILHKETLQDTNNDENTQSNHYTQFSNKIFKGSKYMPTFIKEAPGKSSCICMKCRDPLTGKLGQAMLVNSLLAHIKSDKHYANTDPKEHKKLQELITLLEGTKKNKEINSEDKEDKTDFETKSFLKFLGFLIGQNLSFSQIHNIGSYLQKAANEKGLGFLKISSFNEELLSKITRECFRPILIDGIINSLKTKPFSLSLDNATFSGEHFCALKVKFLDLEWNDELQENISTIKNKIIALHNLKESSSGKTMEEILNLKLFQTEEIKNNLIGIVHDCASSFTGSDVGLINLLQKAGKEFLTFETLVIV